MMDTYYGEFTELEKLLKLCLCTDPYREAMNFVFSDGRHLVSNDGQVIAFSDGCHGLDEGLYEIVRKGRNCIYVKVEDRFDERYPDWEKVLNPIDIHRQGHDWNFASSVSPWCRNAYADMHMFKSYIRFDHLKMMEKAGLDWTSYFLKDSEPWRFEAHLPLRCMDKVDAIHLIVMPVHIPFINDANKGE